MKFAVFYLHPLDKAVKKFGWVGSYCLLTNHWGRTRLIPAGFTVKKKTVSMPRSY